MNQLELSYTKARSLLEEKKVTPLDSKMDLWRVIGDRAIYLVIRGLYCSCPHFTVRTLRGDATDCYHLLAVNLANLDEFSIRLPRSEVLSMI
jgi:predicted nucleic acid-binding Zn finger protein